MDGGCGWRGGRRLGAVFRAVSRAAVHIKAVPRSSGRRREREEPEIQGEDVESLRADEGRKGGIPFSARSDARGHREGIGTPMLRPGCAAFSYWRTELALETGSVQSEV